MSVSSKKEIHIVFRVLNFLYSDHHLAQITTPSEHLLLINLASHQGKRGICPSVSLIAKELKVNRKTVMRSVQRWEELEVIQVQKQLGKKSYYLLFIPAPTGDIIGTGSKNVTGDIHGTTPVTFTTTTGDIHGTTYITKEQLSNNKKLLMQNQKAENERRHDFALSMDQMAREKENARINDGLKKVGMPDNVRDNLISLGMLKK